MTGGVFVTGEFVVLELLEDCAPLFSLCLVARCGPDDPLSLGAHDVAAKTMAVSNEAVMVAVPGIRCATSFLISNNLQRGR